MHLHCTPHTLQNTIQESVPLPAAGYRSTAPTTQRHSCGGYEVHAHTVSRGIFWTVAFVLLSQDSAMAAAASYAPRWCCCMLDFCYWCRFGSCRST